MKKIGLFGGSFNPPHLGHMLIAMEVKTKLHLDEIWFIPTYLSPHKKVRTDSNHRMAMLKEATNLFENFKVSSVELERKGKSYTYDTVITLKKDHPNKQFYFIIGADLINDINSWYRIDDLKQMVQFVGVNREGATLEKTPSFIETIEVSQIDISSTKIRNRIEKQQPITYYVTENVEKYIQEHRLYEYK